MRHLIQDAIDKIWGIVRAKPSADLDGLIQTDVQGDIRAENQLISGHA